MLPSEAARVMEISLGKLANIRSQRVSGSLHKNLLVANILNQVRTIVTVDDTYDAWCVDNDCSALKMTPTSLQMNQSNLPLGNQSLVGDEIFVPPDDNGHQQYGLSYDSNLTNGDIEDKKFVVFSKRDPNMVFVDECFSSNMLIDSSRENVETRGSKRRLDENDQDNKLKKRRSSPVNSHWRAPLLQVSDFEDDSSGNGFDGYETSASSNSDSDASMSDGDTSVVETEQISSLVSVFNLSFKGLGQFENTVEDQVHNPKVSAPEPEVSDEKRYPNHSSGCTLRRGISLPDLCAKQAELLCQQFQKNPQVVALTV